MQNSKIIEDNRRFIWHPFTQMKTASNPIVITKGLGCYLHAEDGSSYLDGISSWWANLHGHAHPFITQAIYKQALQLEHLWFAGFTHEPAVNLARRLLSLLPNEMSKIFYSDNGSTAVETALKMALQYWMNKDPKTKRKKVISFKNSYHGDTFGAMSASGKNHYNRPFWDHLFPSEQIDIPISGIEERSVAQIEKMISDGCYACFIFEPLILAAGGMFIYPAKGLDVLLQICRKYEVITIADEVATGFGRTGPLFASEYLNEQPDIICLSKGITGGFLPLGVTACKSFIFEAFLSEDPTLALLHGHTYCANPLACAAALANLDLLDEEVCSKQRKMIAESHKNFCSRISQHPKLKRCESLGTILVIEYGGLQESSYFHSLRDRLYSFFLQKKIILRPLGNVIYVLPPYCINQEELQTIYQAIILSLEEIV